MRISVIKAGEISAALQALDGYDQAVKDGERDRVVRTFYTLGGGLRLLIAQNINALKPLLEAHRDARNALVMTHAEPGTTEVKANTAAAVAFAAAEKEMLTAEQEIELKTIKEAELKLDQNPIPASVLALLLPILDAA